MKVTLEDIGPVQKKINVEIPAEDVSKEISNAYRLLANQVSVKGFRKGKVPRSVLERMYADHVNSKVAEALIEETLPGAIEESDCKLILNPQVDSVSSVKDGESFTYSATLDIWPEFELPEYKGIELEEPEVEVSDEEVQEQLDALLRYHAEVKDIEDDRPVQEGDIVVIDYEGTIDGEPVEDLKEEDYYLEVGAGNFNEKFEAELVGMSKGDEKDIEISYPDDALNATVAGKTVVYHVRVKNIRERVLPELNDEFVGRFGPDFKTVDDLKARLREQLIKDKEAGAKAAMKRQLLDKLVDQVDFPIPERLIESKLSQIVDNLEGHFQERGYDMARAGIDEDRLKEKMREDAIRQVRLELILDRISDKEEIHPSYEEMEPYYAQVAKQASESNLDENQVREAIVGQVLPKLRSQKTVEFLLENAVIKKEKKGLDKQEKDDDNLKEEGQNGDTE